jgi:hypothetical protein
LQITSGVDLMHPQSKGSSSNAWRLFTNRT